MFFFFLNFYFYQKSLFITCMYVSHASAGGCYKMWWLRLWWLRRRPLELVSKNLCAGVRKKRIHLGNWNASGDRKFLHPWETSTVSLDGFFAVQTGNNNVHHCFCGHDGDTTLIVCAKIVHMLNVNTYKWLIISMGQCEWQMTQSGSCCATTNVPLGGCWSLQYYGFRAFWFTIYTDNCWALVRAFVGEIFSQCCQRIRALYTARWATEGMDRVQNVNVNEETENDPTEDLFAKIGNISH